MTPKEQALDLIFTERENQDEKWGEQNHSPILWTAILTEEVGEFAQAALHQEFGGEKSNNVLTEAVQCAAVAFNIVESLIRNRA